MAGRIRTIKPEVLSDGKSARLSDAAWRLWVSTWTLADDEGRFPCDPVWLCGQVFWAAPRDCTPLIVELERNGQVRRYVANGEPYAEICGWKKHQKINRPSGARYPVPDGFSEPSLSPQLRLTEGSLPSTTTTTTTSLTSPSAPVFDLEAIYALYPRKGDGKAKGIERLKAQIKNRETYEQALLAVRHYAEKTEAEQTPLQYVKQFSTWCNKHWRDYVDGPHIVASKRGYSNYEAPRAAVSETREDKLD